MRRRIDEVLDRYGPDHVVARSVTAASNELIRAAENTEALLASLFRIDRC